MRLLSGEKTPLCKNICCGNGCQTPFCGLRLFFAQRLSFVLIIYVGERIMIKNLEYVATQLSSPQLGCVYFLFFMVRNISLWFSGLLVCTLSHVLWLYRIQKVNYDALRLVWTFFFFLTQKCFAIKHLSKHIFCVHYVVLWASCLKMITKKILFNYSWCDRYHVWRKSLEKRNRHCPLLFRMISLWKMQFLFPLKKKQKTLFSHSLC